MVYQHLDRNIAIVCNPLKKRTAKKLTDKIVRTLCQKKISHSVFIDYWPQVWDDFSEVWIIGGDGTLNYFINHNPEIKLPLSFFKGGTGNDFHFALYGNISVKEQIERVLKRNIYFIDAGICNSKLFLNGLGIGFDGAIVQKLNAKLKSGKKKLYYLTVLRSIFKYRSVICNVITTESEYKEKCFMISVANGKRYGGGFMVTPKAVLNDGLLDVSIIGRIDALQRLHYFPLIMKGTHIDLPFIKYHQSKSVVISSTNDVPAHIDGEPLSSSYFKIDILPKRFSFMR